MNRRWFITFVMVVGLALAGSSATRIRAAVPAPSARAGSTADGVSRPALPAGVSADWWAAARQNIELTAPATTPVWSFESDQAGAQLGWSVATAGDVNGDGYDDIIVGARLYDSGATDSGRAWVFYGSPTGPHTAPDWTANPPYVDYYGYFGKNVGTAGDVNGDGYDDIMISLENYDYAYSDEGAVFVWYGSATGVGGTYNWMARGDATYAHFGVGMGTAGDVNGDGYDDIIVGAYRYDYNDVAHARVWYGSATGLGPNGTPANADWTAAAPTYDGNGIGFGYFVGTAGDVNGDGCADIFVSASHYSHPETNEGAVFVWYGSATGLGDPGALANADWMAESNQANAYLGGYGDGFPGAATAGDVNDDGYDDFIVGARYSDPEVNEGAVFLWYGSASGLGTNGTPDNAGWSAESNQAGALFEGVATAEDVNCDGYDDILVGAYGYDVTDPVTLTNAGAVFVWYGSATGMGEAGTPANADWVIGGDQAGAYLGFSLGTAGDVNGDGTADVIMGAPYYAHPDVQEGRAFVYLGAPCHYLYLPLVLRVSP